jgi:hypothetical protein
VHERNRRHLVAAVTSLMVTAFTASVKSQDVLPAVAFSVFTDVALKAAIESVRPQLYPAIHSRALAGTVYFGLSDVEPGGSERGAIGLGLHLQGSIAERTRLAMAIVRGPVDILSVIGLTGRGRTTGRVELLNPRWHLQGGDFVAPVHALTASGVNADGVVFRHNGRLVAEVMAGRPKYLGGGGGHFLHASAGIKTARFTFRALATDLSRPPPASARIRVVSTPVVESERDVSDLRTLATWIPGDHMLRTVGGELGVRLPAGHEILVRAGVLEAHGQRGIRAHGVSSEARYGLTNPRLTLNAYARKVPGMMADTHLSGEAASLVTTVTIADAVKALADANWNSTPVMGISRPVLSRSAAVGFQYLRSKTRVAVRAKVRELRSAGLERETATVNVNLAVPRNWATLTGDVDLGRTEQNGVTRPYRALRGRVSLFDDAVVSAGISGSLDQLGIGPTRSRVDADLTITWRNYLIEAGAGYGAGQLLGDLRHLWAQLEAPLPRAVTLVVSAEHVRWNHASSPYVRLVDGFTSESPWRLGVGVRRQLSLPLGARRDRDWRGVMPYERR